MHLLLGCFCPGPHALLEVASSPHSGHGDSTRTSPRRSRAILTGQVCGAEDKQAYQRRVMVQIVLGRDWREIVDAVRSGLE